MNFEAFCECAIGDYSQLVRVDPHHINELVYVLLRARKNKIRTLAECVLDLRDAG
jgi:hypothetical protein